MIERLIRWTIYYPFRKLCSKIFIKKVSNRYALPDEGFIAAANHSSYLDILSLSDSIFELKNKEARYLAKKELVQNPIIHWIFRIGNQIIFDRKLEGQRALQDAIGALKNKDVVGIFPEGTRSLDGKIQKGKTGVARLALWAKAPVVPVGIKGAYELMPKGTMIPKFKKNILVKIGKPIYFNKYYNKKITKKLLRQLTNKIMKEIAKLSNQV